MSTVARSRPKVNGSPNAVRFPTYRCFDSSHQDEETSAIDRYYQRTRELVTLYGNEALMASTTFGTLVLLGGVSAVESYCREVLRRTIWLDQRCKKHCQALEIPFGAVTVHSEEMLPEALLEGFTFSNGNNIKKAIKRFLGIQKLNASFEEALREFDEVCQLRHCAVHRFGRLGVQNAILLGLDEHMQCVEKPLALSFDDIQIALTIGTNLVLEMNDFLFWEILVLSAKHGAWTWDGRRDRRIFSRYFDLFYSREVPPSHRLTSSEAYLRFRDIGRNLGGA